MKAVVVYESLWGNTAAIARAIAEGIGEGTPALATSEATGEAMSGVDLIVAGAPLMGFSLPTKSSRDNLRRSPGKGQPPPDLSHPALREWRAAMPSGSGRSAAFETRFKWSPGSATGTIERELTKAGYPPGASRERFIVKGTYGPLREGELERAREWGAQLARLSR